MISAQASPARTAGNCPAPPSRWPEVSPRKNRPVWGPGDIDLATIDLRQRDNTLLLYLLVMASFIESGSDVYTRNLLTIYGGDAHIANWLRGTWEPEELQHGAALRAYVHAMWPDFAWDRAFARFMEEYAESASPEAFAPTPQRELAARCMIETGTTTFYQMLIDYAEDPVLRRLLGFIRNDEVDHYKHFLRYFREGQGAGGGGALSTGWTILRRSGESRSDDAWIAYRHVYESVNPGKRCTRLEYRRWLAQTRTIIRQRFPFTLAAQMLLAPLALPPVLRGGARWLARSALRLAMLS